jgi:uncharacterized protein YjbJ (UPF0337 family)
MSQPMKQQAEGAWKQMKGRIQEAWGALTNDDMDRFEGKRDQLEGHIEKKTGESRARIRRKLDRLADDSSYSF